MIPERIGKSDYWKLDDSGQVTWIPNNIGYDKILELKIPKYYNNNKGVDVIDFCNMYSLNFNRGNIIKYVCRAGKKDDELKDLEKALAYLTREINFIKNK